MPRSNQGTHCRRHRARGNDVAGVPMSALSPGTVCGSRRHRRYPVSRAMLELARPRVGLLVANLEEERVAFETVGDLQQCQSQRGTGVWRELGRFGSELEQQTFVVEHPHEAARERVGLIVRCPKSP